MIVIILPECPQAQHETVDYQTRQILLKQFYTVLIRIDMIIMMILGANLNILHSPLAITMTATMIM